MTNAVNNYGQFYIVKKRQVNDQLVSKLSDSVRARVRENRLADWLMAGAKRNQTAEMGSLIG